MTHNIQTQLEQISAFIRQQQLVQKQILTLAEATVYTGLSKSYLYKKTAAREIPFYRLDQKLLYFKREDLDAYLLSKPQPTVSAMTDRIASKCGKTEPGTSRAKLGFFSSPLKSKHYD